MKHFKFHRLNHKGWLCGLFILGFILTSLVSFKLTKVTADTITKNGNITVSTRVPGPPPSQPATIQLPTNGQHFIVQDITVSGTCPTGVPIIVEIYRNGTFAGSTNCQNDGRYSLSITLLNGQNQLLAKIRDSLDQYGPDSQSVTVFLDVSPVTVPSNQSPTSNAVMPNSQNPLRIIVAPVFRGTFAGDQFNLNFSVSGGSVPYAISIIWGDSSKQDLIALPISGDVNQAHLYKSEGIYKIVITAVDSQDQSSDIQTVVIINKSVQSPNTFNVNSNTRHSSNIFDDVLISGLILLFLITSFWLGEKYEKHELESHNQLKPPGPQI